MIERFITILRRAEVDLDYRQIEEVLWLSGVLPKSAVKEGAESPEAPVEVAEDRKRDQQPFERPATRPQASDQTRDLYTSSSAATGAQFSASRVRVPAASALPEALLISRALRPLSRRVKSKYHFMLDEDATVEQSARSRMITPVFTPASERWFDVALVAEDAPSMVVWRQTVRELAILLERQGAFRDVRRWRLRIESGKARLIEPDGAMRSVKVLNDPNSRRLVVLLSDCASPCWRDGSLSEVLLEWGTRMPVVIGHMLSERLWRHTATGEASVTVASMTPGAPNRLLDLELPWWEEEIAGRLPFPIVSLNHELIGRWAKLLTSVGAKYKATLLPTEPSATVASEPQTAEERIDLFRSVVSDDAYDLAVFLSVMPLTLPVMRLVHQAMIRNARQEQLAEVLLGRIIRRRTPPDERHPPEEIEYEFYPGVREILQSDIQYSELDRIFQSVSNFIGQRIGSTRDFVAWIKDSEGDAQISASSLRFAEIAIPALERMGLTNLLKDVDYDARRVWRKTDRKTGEPSESVDDDGTPGPEVLGSHPSVESLVNQADSLLTQEKFAEAESLYRRAIGILPADNRAWRGLAEIVRRGLGSEETLRIMLAALRHFSPHARKAAAIAMGGAGIASREFIGALLVAMLDKSNLVQEAALESLRILANENSTAVSSALIETLLDKSSEARAKAADVLGDIGDESAIPALRNALQDEDARVRRSALNALEKLGAATEQEIGRARIFISHASADYQSANDMYGFLAIHGFEVESSDYSFSDRRKWDSQFEKWIWKYDLFLVCLSRNNFEEMTNSEGRILSEMRHLDISPISVRLEECEIPEGLEGGQCVNFYEGDGKDRLLRAIRSELRRRQHSSETQSHRLHSSISDALTDKLATADVLSLVDQLREMTAIEVCRVMNEAGITYVAGDEGEKLFVNDSTVECDPVSQGGKQARQLLIEAQRRCLVIKSPEFIRSLIPLRGLNSNLIAETERIAQAVLEAVDEPSVPNFITLDTDNQRIAALRTAADLSERFPDGLLFIDLEGRKISQTELRLACLNPFVKLGDDPVGSQLLVEERFIEVFSQKRVLIIFDKVGDLRGLESFPRLPRGSVMIVIFQAANRNRQAGLSRYDEASKSYAQAIAAYDEALRRDPDDVQVYSDKGNALQSLGDLQAGLSRHDEASESYAKAIAAYDEALRRAPDDVSAHNNKGNALYSLGDLRAKLSRHDEASESYAKAIAAFDEALRVAPNDVSAHNNKGNALTSLGKLRAELSRYDEALDSYAGATAAFDEVLRRAPDDVYVHNNKGTALTCLGDLQARLSQHGEASESYAKAIMAYDETLRRDPDDVSAHNNKGEALQRLGEMQVGLSRHDEASESYAKAIAAFDEALRRAPDYAYVHSNKGNALRNLGEMQTRLSRHGEALESYAKALDAFDEALRKAPDDVSAHNGRGTALTSLGDLLAELSRYDEATENYAKAAEAYDEALRRAPDDVSVHNNKGLALRNIGGVQAGLSQYDEASKSYAQAVAAFDEALRRAPDYVYVHNNKGNVFQSLGELRVRLSRYEEASESYALALAAFDEALRRAPDYASAHNSRGTALTSLGDLQARLSRHDEALESYAKAIAACDEALRRAPGDVSAHNNKGNALTSRGKLQARLSWHDEASESYARATAVYDEALRRAPDNVYAHNNKGLALRNLGDSQAKLSRHDEASKSYAEAVAAFDEALRIAPGHVQIYNNRVNALKSLGELQDVNQLSFTAGASILGKPKQQQLAWLADRITGDSPAIQESRELLRLAIIKQADSVLFMGETGTGKGVCALAIHEGSGARGRFIEVNCAELPRVLIESELFGHEKGSFTGATGRKIGLFEQADGGTIFLDEIAELPPDLQVKLLTVLQRRELRRVGGVQAIPINVRVIAATNRPLEIALNDGTFRRDLFFRIGSWRIELPSLRDRGDDVIQLARHFIAELVKSKGYRVEGLAPEAEDLLKQYDWPGNVRQLLNVLRRAIILESGNVISLETIHRTLKEEKKLFKPDHSTAPSAPQPSYKDLKRILITKAEARAITEALARNRNNKTKTAKELGLTRGQLNYRLNLIERMIKR